MPHRCRESGHLRSCSSGLITGDSTASALATRSKFSISRADLVVVGLAVVVGVPDMLAGLAFAWVSRLVAVRATAKEKLLMVGMRGEMFGDVEVV